MSVLVLVGLLSGSALAGSGAGRAHADQGIGAFTAASAVSFMRVDSTTQVQNVQGAQLVIDPAGETAVYDHTGAYGGAGTGGEWKLHYSWSLPSTLVAGQPASITLGDMFSDVNPPNGISDSINVVGPELAKQFIAMYPGGATSQSYPYTLSASQTEGFTITIGFQSSYVIYHYAPVAAAAPTTPVSVPLTVAAAPLAAAFGAVVQVEVPSGGDGLAASPPLGNTRAATVTDEGLSPEDTTVAALVTYAALRHQCYVMAVKNAVGWYKLNRKISQGAAQDEAAIQKLSESIAEGIPKYIKACLALVDAAVASPAATASASTCPVTPLTIVSQRRNGKTSISKVHGGAVKGLSVTCSRSAGVLTMHLRSKAGTPLSKFVGSRLRIAVARSKHDPGPATLSFSFHKG
jgi:hypothetical protein